jgi:tetratricopeptide (TPR) repeat protein
MKRWQEAKAYADQIFQTKPDPRVRTFYDRYYFALGLDRLSAGDTGKSREAFKKVTDSKIANTFVTALQKIDARDYTEAMELLDQLHKTNPTYQYAYGEEVPFSCPWDAWEAIIRSELESAYSLSYRLDVEKAALYLTTRQWETKQTTAALSGIQLSDITVQRNGSSLEDLNADTSIEITDTLNDLYKQCGTDPQGKILVLRKAKELYDESLTIALEMMQQLPYEYFPEDLSQVEYIILLDYSFWKTGYYNNFWGGRIHAVKEQCTVKVLQMPTRQQIYSGGTLTGGDPPQSIRVGMNNNPSFVSGGAPKLDEKLTGALKAIETKIAAKK